MAILTWRNVDAPNYAGALDGQRLAATLLDRAAGNLQTGITGFRQDQSRMADSLALQESLKFTDPAAYRAALASGAIAQGAGVDPTQLSPEAVAAMGKRTGTLAYDASMDVQNQRDSMNLQLLKDREARQQVASPAASSLIAAALSNDPAKIATASQGLAGSGLRADEQFEMLRNSQSLANGVNTNRAGVLSNQALEDSYKDKAQYKRDSEAAAQLFQTVRTSAAGGSLDDMYAAARPGMEKLSANQRVIFDNLVRGSGTDPFALGSGAGAAPAGSPASALTGSVIGSAAASNITYPETKDYVTKITAAAGDVTGTIDEKVQKLLPHLIKQESNGNTNAVSPKGAQGLMQLMPDTAKELAGKLGIAYDKDKLLTDPEYNKKLGSEYLRQQLVAFNGNVPAALAAYNAGPAAAGKWFDKNAIKLSDVSPTKLTAAAVDESQIAGVQNRAVPGVDPLKWEAAQKSTESIGEVVDSMMTGSFKGASKRALTRDIERVMQEGKVTAPVARLVVDSAYTASNFWDITEGSVKADRDKLNAGIKALQPGGGLRDQLVADRQYTANAENANAYKSAAAKAQADLTAREEMQKARPELPDRLPLLRQKLQEATDNYQTAIGNVAKTVAPVPSPKVPERSTVPPVNAILGSVAQSIAKPTQGDLAPGARGAAVKEAYSGFPGSPTLPRNSAVPVPAQKPSGMSDEEYQQMKKEEALRIARSLERLRAATS